MVILTFYEMDFSVIHDRIVASYWTVFVLGLEFYEYGGGYVHLSDKPKIPSKL